MKSFMGGMLVLIGLGIASYALGLGLEYKDCGCGCCGGSQPFPNYPTMYYWEEYKHIEKLPYEYCQLVGCSSPRVPLFVDLYGLAGVVFLFGVLTLGKNETSVV